jgi:formiminotetrahydrofolate cyclodeaminase
MLYAACEGAGLNVRINLNALENTEFVSWKTQELESILRTGRMMLEETLEMVAEKMKRA